MIALIIAALLFVGLFVLAGLDVRLTIRLPGRAQQTEDKDEPDEVGTMTPADIVSIVGLALDAAIRAGAAISAEQRTAAEHAAIAALRAPGPDVAADYHAALRARSDADELELRQRRVRDEVLGVTPPGRDTVPSPPDTLRVLDPHDHDDGEG